MREGYCRSEGCSRISRLTARTRRSVVDCGEAVSVPDGQVCGMLVGSVKWPSRVGGVYLSRSVTKE